MPLPEALRALAFGLGAEAAVLSRHSLNQDRPRAVSIYDVMSGDADAVTIRRPLCQDVMGYMYPKARASTVWFMSELVGDANWTPSNTLENWRLSRGVEETVVVALAGSVQQQDYLEFHYSRQLAYSEKLEIEGLVRTLVRAWAGRKTGLVTQAQMDERMVRARALAASERLKPDAPILGVANPAKLSRAEFRVCLLLSRGLSVKGVTAELGLSEATVRSHLRSIYSKTEVAGLPELLYRILSAGSEDNGRSFGRA